MSTSNELVLFKQIENQLSVNPSSGKDEIILRIPRDIYIKKFPYGFTDVQSFIKEVCSKYKLEVMARDNTVFDNNDSEVITIRFRRDKEAYTFNKRLNE